ncbi:MAG: DUF4402 domain-containing protein [Sphingomonadaceae bacterium]|nr:DUF4402 domain-containing protein [Sphingomonadaceae bacterium]
MVFFVVAMPAAATAQDQTANTKIVVVRPLTLVKDEDLDFGLILPGSSQGFVILNPDGSVTTSGGVIAVAGDPQAATFYGYGRYRQYLRLRISANRYFLRRQGGNETMRMDDIVIGSNPPTELTTNPRLFYIGSPDGFFGFSLGGRLRVGANQTPGVYVGEFDVLIEYL